MARNIPKITTREFQRKKPCPESGHNFIFKERPFSLCGSKTSEEGTSGTSSKREFHFSMKIYFHVRCKLPCGSFTAFKLSFMNFETDRPKSPLLLSSAVFQESLHKSCIKMNENETNVSVRFFIFHNFA